MTSSAQRDIKQSPPNTLQLKYSKLASQTTSKIPIISSSRSSRSISIQLDDLSTINGQTKKSFIPRIASSPITQPHISDSVVRKNSSPTINKIKSPKDAHHKVTSPLTPKRPMSPSHTKTPPSTLTKLAKQLETLTLDSPTTALSVSKRPTRKVRELEPRHKPSSFQNIITKSAFSTFERNVSASDSSTNHSPKQRAASSPILSKTSALLKSRMAKMDEESADVLPSPKNAEAGRIYNRIATSTVPRESPSKRRVLTTTAGRRTSVIIDDAPLLSRLTRSTTASDLKSFTSGSTKNKNQFSHMPIPRKTSLSQVPKSQSVTNSPSSRAVSDKHLSDPRTRIMRSSRLKHDASMTNLQSKVAARNIIQEEPDSSPRLSVQKKRMMPRSATINSNLKDITHHHSPQLPVTRPQVNSKRPSYRLSSYSSTPSITQRKKGKVGGLEELRECLLLHPSTASLVQEFNNPPTPHHESAIFPAMSPDEILKNYQELLSPYERMEVMKTKEIYFLGSNRSRKGNAYTTALKYKQNFGFDDENKNLLISKGDHINYRFEVLNDLGSGMFGNVLKCFDHKLGRIFGIKVMKNDIDWSLQSINEIKILKKLQLNNQASDEDGANDTSRILKYIDHFNFRSHICITTELLSFNLLQVLESTSYRGLEIPIIRSWSKQILEGLAFMHSHRIIHADLKPENIMLVNGDSLELKIIDFGSSCYVNDVTFPYIQSRFYRAPEVLLGARYDTKIDIWSFITLIYEMHIGSPLFQAKDETQLFNFIVKLIGLPNPKTILSLRDDIFARGSINKNKGYGPDEIFVDKSSILFTKFDRMGNYRGLPLEVPNKTQPFGKRLGDLNPTFADFLKVGLLWDPKERYDATKLLQHDFLDV